MDQLQKREIRNSPVQKTVLLAILIAISSVIQVVENQVFPSNLPLRPGFANVAILLVISMYGPREAVLTAVARSVLASLVTGRLLSAPFFLSLSGGIVSALIMGFLLNRFEELSIVGVSLTGAIVHNTTQLMVIRLFLISHGGVLALVPWIWILSLITGLFVGFTARWILGTAPAKKLANPGGNSPDPVKI